MPRRLAERGGAAALVFALLVLATVAAFAYAQHVKRAPLVLDRATFVAVPNPNPNPARERLEPKEPVRSFTPNDDCRFDRVRIRFRITRSDDGTVQVIKPGGRVVYTLARDEFLKRYRYHTYYWDGRQRGGGTAPPGRYKLRVKLLGQDRTLVAPGSIRLHRARPGVESACGERAGTGGLEPAS